MSILLEPVLASLLADPALASLREQAATCLQTLSTRPTADEGTARAHAAHALIECILLWLPPSSKLQAQLDSGADGASVAAPSKLSAWRDRTGAMLQMLPELLRMVEAAGTSSAAALLGHPAASRTGGSPTATSRSRRAASDTRWQTMSEQKDTAVAKRDAVRSDCSLVVQLLAALDEVAAEGGTQEPAAEPCHSEAMAALAASAVDALASAAGEPVVRLRMATLGDECRLLHMQLELAEAARSTHRTRRVAAALGFAARSLRRPHLANASDSHKLLPLLLRWSELIDTAARASILRAVRHMVDELPAAELRWQSALLSHTLRKMLVFREEAALEHLLPALFSAWPHVTSEHTVADAEQREVHMCTRVHVCTCARVHVCTCARVHVCMCTCCRC